VNRRCFVFVLGVALVAGCGKSHSPAADPERARKALTAALDAWKGGERLETLQARTPAIYFNDELSAEKRLVKYDIEAEAANGLGWRCDVLLTIDGGNGKENQRRVGYQIDTDPAIVIVQQP
jgi:hypothetical protein